MEIHSWFGNCQSNSGVRGYCDIGGWGWGIAVEVHGWSGDCQSNSGLQSGGQTRQGTIIIIYNFELYSNATWKVVMNWR